MTSTAALSADPLRLRALRRANEIRLERAQLKRRIAAGELSAAAVILDCPDAARSWPIAQVLASQRRWGQSKCTKLLRRVGVSERKPLGELTTRQRRLLAAALTSA